MILITLATLFIIFEACFSSKDINLCSIENDTFWYITEYKENDAQAPFSRRFLSDDDVKEYITFSLYTWLNPTEPQILTQDERSLTNSNFDNRSMTVFLIHGWLGSGNNSMNTLLVEAFLKDATPNVIVVDWSYWASFNYITSMLTVSNVGIEVGTFIEWLTGFGVSYESVHIVGFSLGCHIAGEAGRKTASRVRRITALDPAGVMWSVLPHHVGNSDAQYVEVIHTNSKLYGLKEPCGHADFYPNGGEIMPNCWLNMCSHSMAYEYMAESVKYNNMKAHSCKNLSQIFADTCSGDSYLMGNSDLSKNISGLFRLNIIDGRRSFEVQDSEDYDKERCY